MIGALPSLISNIPPVQRNPSDTQRHQILYTSLVRDGRPEDHANIVSLLSPPNDIADYGRPGAFKYIRVGIIGGGLAGMAAAFELRKLGFDITIFEPRTDRIGGKVYTYYFDEDKSLYGELGAFRFPVSHETTWHYINLFKLNTEAFIQDYPNDIIYVRDTRIRNDSEGKNIQYKLYPKFNMTEKERNTPWPKIFTQVSKYYLATMPPEVKKELLMVLNKYDYRLEALTRISAMQAMRQYGLSDEAINMISNIIPLVGTVIYVGYDNTMIDDYSLDYLNLYTISGGMVNLPLAFYNSLTNPNPTEYSNVPQDALGKISWRSGQIVTGISKSDVNGKVTLRYNILPSTEELFETFDYVLSAASFSALRSLTLQPKFSPAKMQAIKEVHYEDTQKTLFLCKERFWEKQGIYAGTSYTDDIISSIQYPLDHFYCTSNEAYCSPDQPGVLTASYNIDQDALRLGMESDDIRFALIKREVEAVHGLPKKYLDNIVTQHITEDWYRSKWFYGAFQTLLPGQREYYLYASSSPEYDNRVFFAGEHTSPKNVWMQGALHSGMLAANNIAFYAQRQIEQK